MSFVIDASALLALMFAERGADKVLGRAQGGYISAVNMVEILAKCAAKGIAGSAVRMQAARLKIIIVPFSEEAAQIAADLLPDTRPHGLSLADRACLALAKSLELPVLTADRDWAALDVGVEIILIR